MRRVLAPLLTVLLAGIFLLAAAARPASASPSSASPASASPASAAPSERVIVIAMDGTALPDWIAHGGPQLQALMKDGSTALLSSRNALPLAKTPADCMRRGAAGAGSMLAGERLTDKVPAGDSPLAKTLTGAGLQLRSVTAALPDSGIPGGTRSFPDGLAEAAAAAPAGAVIIPIVETLAADCLVPAGDRSRWIARALATADTTIERVQRSARASDTLMVVSRVSPFARERTRDFLTAIAIKGPGFASGSLITNSTRRAGIGTLIDVAATIAHQLGAPERVGIGRPLRQTRGRNLAADDATYLHAAQARLGILKTFVYGSMTLIVIAGLLVVAGRGRARGERMPRTGRDLLAVGLSCIPAAPLAMLLEPLLSLRSPRASAVVIALATVALALAARLIAGPARAFGLLAGVTIVTVAGDLVIGAPLSSRSVVSYTMAEGARFYGIGNELMGVLVIGVLLWAAHTLDSGVRAVAAVTAVCATIVVLMAAPPVGAKFGSTLVAVPAFGLLLVRAFGSRLDRRSGLAVAIATTFTAGVAVAIDLSLSDSLGSHLGRVASGEDSGVLGRKIMAAVRLLAGSYWTHGLIVVAVVTGLLLWKRPVLMARATWGRPFLRAVLPASIVGALAAVAFNDAGVIAAGMIVLIGCATLFTQVLTGQAGPDAQ